MLAVEEFGSRTAIAALVFTLSCLALAACGNDDASSQPSLSAGAGAGGADGAPGAGGSPAAGACMPALDCESIEAGLVKLEPCCSAAISCGYKLVEPAELRDIFLAQLGMVAGTDPDSGCVPESTIFRRQAGSTGPNEQRVTVPGGTDILIAHGCEAVILLGVPFAGCCLPTGCGITTYGATDLLVGLAGDPAGPFAQVQCVTSAELNAQLAGSSLQSLARFPDTAGSCDYAALEAAFPPEP